MQTRLEINQKVKYCSEAYNKFNDTEQWIRITDGCPNNCPYCYCPTEIKTYDIPEIVRNDVKIMDMNLLANPNALNIITELGSRKVNNKVVYYDLVCGIDYRFLNMKKAIALTHLRLKKIRFAWDWYYKDQYKILDTIKLLKKVGFKKKQMMVFMICNWKIPYEECCKKLDLLKVWGVQVADCYYNNQTFPNVIPIGWTDQENKDFRHKCRKHNQLINFGIDPEI